ncbi:MAG: hypothetical protein H6807_09770 [Planctomycetes bacterium]|nr:hypothetical protein [Planctomycetota bacterium]
MRVRASLIVVLLLLGGPCLRPLAAAGPPAGQQEEESARGDDRQDLTEARDRLVKSGDYVTQLPDKPFSPGKGVQRRGSVDLGPILEFLGKLLLAVAVLVIIGLVVTNLADRRRRRRRQAEAASASATLKSVDLRVDMAEVESLAAAGRYSEAIHLLLLRTIGELVRLARVEIRRAWTSREIAGRIPLEDEPRADLHDLVHRAELGHFAERPSEPQDYAAARAAFDRLVDRLRGARA